jgi:hypothetical protein
MLKRPPGRITYELQNKNEPKKRQRDFRTNYHLLLPQYTHSSAVNGNDIAKIQIDAESKDSEKVLRDSSAAVGIDYIGEGIRLTATTSRTRGQE